jgi:hypothetical protein
MKTMGGTNETMILLLVVKIFFLLVLSFQSESAVVTKNLSRNVAGLVEWIRSLPNGVVSDKLSIQQDADGTSAHSSSGGYVFLAANADVSEDETLMYIPTEALLAREFAGNNCEMLQVMLNEYDLGKKSAFYPYIRFLFGSEEDDTDSGMRKVTTAAWSSNGQELLRTMLGYGLLPYSFSRTCAKKCNKVCTTEGKDLERQELEQDAFLMLLSRKEQELLIPRKFLLWTNEISRHLPKWTQKLASSHRFFLFSLQFLTLSTIVTEIGIMSKQESKRGVSVSMRNETLSRANNSICLTRNARTVVMINTLM